MQMQPGFTGKNVWNLKKFQNFYLAKCCGSFKKFNTYSLRSLNSGLFFSVNGFFTWCQDPGILTRSLSLENG